MTSGKYEIVGVESSPYTVKVRAVLRYRHLPHIWLCRFPQFYPPLAAVRPLLMPVVRFPDGRHRIDSTPIILELEALHPERRRVQPDDPVLALYSLLIEDMADEWLAKCLFHYRFSHDADRVFASNWVMDDAYPELAAPELAEKAAAFLDRQTGRMEAVGAGPENAPVIEASLHRILDILGPNFAMERFLFGSRPSLADFGLYGQLKTLCTDPTPAALIRATAPRADFWLRRADDLSGVDGAWQDDAVPGTAVTGLLAMAGDTYLPYLRANTTALAEDRAEFTIDLPSGAFRQQTYRYQAKCLDALRTAFDTLTADDRVRANPVLEAAGCLEYLVAD